jgi:hypothetical protein
MSALRFLFALHFAIGLAAPVHSQIAISQACASGSGCFSGDSPGLPVTIDGSAGRSYFLASDLTVPNKDTSGITASAADVSLDLNGFSVRGANVCVPAGCTLTGTGIGVSLLEGSTVKNGSISGHGSHCVVVRTGSTVERIVASHCRYNGIMLGMTSSAYATARDSNAFRNGENGILALEGSIVSNCVARNNNVDGIQATGQGMILNNVVAQNLRHGISCFTGCQISGNNAAGASTGNFAIDAGSTSLVHENRMFFTGLRIGARSAYSQNLIYSGTSPVVTFAGSPPAINAGHNSCYINAGLTTCP